MAQKRNKNHQQTILFNWISMLRCHRHSWFRKWKSPAALANSISILYLLATCKHPINPRKTTTNQIRVIEHRFVVRRTFFVGRIETRVAITIGRKLNAITDLLKHQHLFPNCCLFKLFTICTYSLLLFLHRKITNFTFFDVHDLPGAYAWLYYLSSIFISIRRFSL